MGAWVFTGIDSEPTLTAFPLWGVSFPLGDAVEVDERFDAKLANLGFFLPANDPEPGAPGVQLPRKRGRPPKARP